MSVEEKPGVGTRSNTATYRVFMGATAVALAVGLVVPFAVTEPATEEVGIAGSLGADSAAVDTSSADPAGGSNTPDALDDSTAADAADGSRSGPTTGGRAAARERAENRVVGASGPRADRSGRSDTASGDPIRVGFLVIDLGNAGGLGFPGIGSLEDQKAIYQAYVDNANANGGVGGRPIEAVFAAFDPANNASFRAACLQLTEDEKVFAAVNAGGFVGDSILCFTQEHGTPFLAQTAPADFYTKSNGLLFTMFWNSDRMAANLAQEVHDLGALHGKTVGILFDLRSGPASVADELKKNVERLGHKVGHVSVFSADFGSASTQVPVEINRHRANDVDVILNMSNAVVFAQFVQQAEGQAYSLPYFNSDWNGANGDFYYSNMPASYDGNLNFTIARENEGRAGLPEPAIDAECRRLAEAAVGRSLPQDDPEDTGFSRFCNFFTVLHKGLTGAGAELTPRSFSRALQNVGEFQAPNMSTGRLEPGRFDWGASLRTMQWNAGCRCVLPVTDFRWAKH